jgi:hypothetical protein
MTSAPWSPSIWAANGPASTRDTSRTTTPLRADLLIAQDIFFAVSPFIRCWRRKP